MPLRCGYNGLHVPPYHPYDRLRLLIFCRRGAMRSETAVLTVLTILLSSSLASAEYETSPGSDMRMRPNPQALAGESSADIRYGSSDTAVRARVEQALQEAQLQHLRELSVEVQNGVVHLSGSATKHEAIDAALATALMVNGVDDIENRIVLLNPPPVYSSGKWAGAYSTAGAG